MTTAKRDSGDPWTVAGVFALFARLAERQLALGATLSGGDQRMLAIGRALMTKFPASPPRGVDRRPAPLIRAEIRRCLAELKAREAARWARTAVARLAVER